MLAGTDNDYSVTQNAGGVQFGRYFKPSGTSVSRIQCDLDSAFANCAAVNADGSAGAALPAGFDYAGYTLIPGVLHAYKASPADLAGYRRSSRRP